jgi:hypothetical protein
VAVVARGLFPLPAPMALAQLLLRLRHALTAHDFGATRVLPFPGTASDAVFDVGNARRYHRGEHNVHGTSSIASVFYRQFARTHANAFVLFEIFCLGRGVAESRIAELLGHQLLGEMLAADILVPTDGGLMSRLAATPIGSRIHFHDWERTTEAEKAELVYLGPDSVFLATHVHEHVRSRRIGRALDLCTGGGVQGIEAADACSDVIGVDINARAIALAHANAQANSIRNIRFHVGDLYTGLAGHFDLITANTPFLLLPQDSKRVSSSGGALGIEIALRLFEGLGDHLSNAGQAIVIASSPNVRGTNVLVVRLEEMFGGRGRSWGVDLLPIGLWYPTVHRKEYERQGVSFCTLYLVRVEKAAGDRAGVRVHSQRPWVAGAYWMLALKNRLSSAWRAH